MLKRFVKLVGGNPNQREIDHLAHFVDEINDLEGEFESLSDDELSAKTIQFRERLEQGETLDEILVETFATVREASKRTIGLRHYDVQLIGGVILHQGKIVEMKTGEGKTLVATLPIYLNALTGGGVHLITVNDYLARRDARWMAPIYSLLGLRVGVLQMAARTENGKKAFIVDLEYESPHEDQHQLIMVPRREAYNADITYGTNSEFGFDYLRDNMTMSWENRVQRAHTYAIIDEVDNVLIDEARTPLIISGPAQDEAEWYIRMAQIVKSLRPEDFEVNEKNRNVTLTEVGEMHVEQLLGMTLRDPDRPEDITHQQARTLGYLEQALRAQHLFNRNKEYLVQAGKVVIIDEFTGRLMPGRRWSDGLHQAVEAKEGVKVQSESVTYATITIQNYFRMYEKLAGMTGTAVTEAEEFDKIYKLQVLALPTNLEYQASRTETDLEEIETRDEAGYKYIYYTTKDDPEEKPLFWKRKDYPDVVYRTQEAKLRAIVKEIFRYNVMGRPLLVGTTSVESSELLSRRLSSEPIRRLSQVILLRNSWLELNNRVDDGRIIDELQFLNAPLEQLQISDMRKLARDVGISFNPEDDKNLINLMSYLDIPPEKVDRLITDLQAGIPHQVLNARKHTEESQVIAGAGAFGAVTIATNMAGRGVDIKLGGEMAEEIISAVNRVLRRVGNTDAFEMTIEERQKGLRDLDPSNYGIYEAEIKYFLQQIKEMEMVRELGGLHVIGSERHEARRIDNQLRGRSSRQGDPGSSRFYLSMEDELMRLFGGGQADSLMQRMRIDDAMPLEAGLVSRIVEQAQSRVEGANFDVRKHLLEYDDVLNTQRSKIYEQRNRIFIKDDLTEDVTDMLVTEVSRRIPEYTTDDETDNSWKLLGWLNQIQPPIFGEEFIYPSYTLQLIYNEIENNVTKTLTHSQASEVLVAVANKSIDAEFDYILDSVEILLDSTQKNLDQNITERMDALDIFIDALLLEDEDEKRDGNDLLEELISIVRAPVRLSARQQKDLIQDPELVIEDIRTQVEQIMLTQYLTRLVGSIERRLEEPIEIEDLELSSENWTIINEKIVEAIREIFNKRKLRYLGEQNNENGFTGGLITKDLEKAIAQIDGAITRDDFFRLLILMTQGTRATFDKKTHRRVLLRTTRLNYTYYASKLLNNNSISELSNEVLEHLNGAQSALRELWGLVEWNRLVNSRFEDLNESTKNKLRIKLGDEYFNQILYNEIGTTNGQAKNQIIITLGNLSLTEIYRQLLLSVITELWVEYLTQMEGLRVSIGLEAYAQRDPLVQYKNKAFELYQELLSNVRLSVINRMFTYRPRVSAQPKILENVQAEKSTETIEQDQETHVPEISSQTTSTVEQKSRQKESRDRLSKSQKRRRKRKN